MVPQTPYGDVISRRLQRRGKGRAGADVCWTSSISRPTPASVTAPSAAIAKSGADAVLIAQGGGMLRAIAPTLVVRRARSSDKVKLLGTGPVGRCQHRQGAEPERRLVRRARAQCRRCLRRPNTARSMAPTPPQLASLAYDAVSLVALLSTGTPYHRFTPQRLDGSQWLCRRERHFPFQCRWHLGARTGRLGSAARRLSCREPCAQDLPARRTS